MINNFVVTSRSRLPISYWLLRDEWEHFAESDLWEYFSDGYQIFLRRLDEMKTLVRPLTPHEEAELDFMLNSLIYAKNSLIHTAQE